MSGLAVGPRIDHSSGRPSAEKGGRLRIGLVGAGDAGAHMLGALETLDLGLEVAVDPRGTRAYAFAAGAARAPVNRVLTDLPGPGSELWELIDCWLIAAPTRTHVHLCGLISTRSRGRVLCEKPLADSPDALGRLKDAERVEGLLHFSFAPEVLALADRLPELSERHAGLTGVDARFSDAYSAQVEECTAAMGSSWDASAINALSVLHRLGVTVENCRLGSHQLTDSQATLDLRYEGRQLKGTVVTSWLGAQAEQTTCFRFADGETLLVDHVRRRARIGARELFSFGAAGRRERNRSRYTRLLASHLLGRGPAPIGWNDCLHLNQLMLKAALTPAALTPAGAQR